MHSSLKIALIPTVKCLNERFRPVVPQNLTIFVPRKHLVDSLIISSISNCLSTFWPEWDFIWTKVALRKRHLGRCQSLDTAVLFFSFGLSCDSSTWFNKKETSVFKKIFPLLKKNCIPSSHWLQAVVQICGGQCSFKTFLKNGFGEGPPILCL